jgi:TfoX/Sxy family transcriptional regulator of competence genes
MHSDPKLAERLRLAADKSPLTERVMFGGVAFFCHGNMCVGIYHDSLVLRLGEKQAELALKKTHVRPMDITGKPMRGWVFVAPPGCKTKRQLDNWVAIAVDFSKTLPVKKKPATGRKKKK